MGAVMEYNSVAITFPLRIRTKERSLSDRRGSDLPLSDGELIRAHPQLMSELAEQLAALGQVEGAQRHAVANGSDSSDDVPESKTITIA